MRKGIYLKEIRKDRTLVQGRKELAELGPRRLAKRRINAHNKEKHLEFGTSCYWGERGKDQGRWDGESADEKMPGERPGSLGVRRGSSETR